MSEFAKNLALLENREKTIHNVKTYEPNYIRLNKEPQVMEVEKHAFIKPKGKPPTRILEEDTVQEIPRVLPHLKEMSIPEQKHVYVGNNSNWFESSKEIFDLNMTETIETTEEAIKIEVEPLEETKETPQLSSLQVNEYCLMVKNNIIATSVSMDSLVLFIEDILFGGDPKFKEVTALDLCLIKRLDVRVGVSVVENG